MDEERNVDAAVSIASEKAKQWFTKALRAYKIAFVAMVVTALILVVLAVVLNQTSLAVLNFTLAAVFVVIWGFFTLHPAGLLGVFGLGTLNGLPKDWSVNRLIRERALPDLSLSNMAKEGFALIGQWARYSAHVAYFCIVVLTVLGTWYVRNPVAVLPVLMLLAGIGYWAVLSKAAAKWYYGITLGLLIASLGVFLYRGFIAEQSASAWQAINVPEVAKSAKEHIDGVSLWSHPKTLDLVFSDLKDTKLCGIDPGKRKYSFPREELLEEQVRKGRLAIRDHPSYHTLEARGKKSRYNMADHIRVNGTIPGEILEVGDDGCVTVTHLHPEWFKKEAVIRGNHPDSEPQTVVIRVRFE